MAATAPHGSGGREGGDSLAGMLGNHTVKSVLAQNTDFSIFKANCGSTPPLDSAVLPCHDNPQPLTFAP